MKKSPSGRRQEQTEHVGSPGGFAEDRDPVGIAAEDRDFVPNPLQSPNQVQGAVVSRTIQRRRSRRAQTRMGEPTENAQAVLERHDDDPLAPGQRAAIVDPGASDGVAPAVDPDHDRQPFTRGSVFGGVRGRCKYIQEEAVLAARQRSGLGLGIHRPGELNTLGSERQSLSRLAPRLWRARRLPTQIARGWLGEGNPQPSMSTLLVDVAHHRTRAHRTGSSGTRGGRRLGTG